jgi:hypothetical protein
MSLGASYRALLAPISTCMAALALTLPAPAAGAPAFELRDGGQATISLGNARPGDSATGCVVLSYRGDEPARVRLFGKTGGTGFDRYLDLLVERGASCASFRAVDVAYDGTLEDFPDTRRDGIDERWKADEARAYRFEIRVRDANGAQGLTAKQTFTWVATSESAAPKPGATAPPSTTGGGLIPVPPSPQGLRTLLEKIAKVAVEVGKRSAFPTGLLMLVLGFLSVQNRIDRRDPKLALAPVYPTPDLAFSGPEDGDAE